MDVTDEELYAFIFERIETVPHLEALLQLWHSRPKQWAASDIAGRLFLDDDIGRTILADLAQSGLITSAKDRPNHFYYAPSPANDRMMTAVAFAYRTDLVGVSTAIHARKLHLERETNRRVHLMRNSAKS